jgi:ADP-heptose:LPS heptosyltransferase
MIKQIEFFIKNLLLNFLLLFSSSKQYRNDYVFNKNSKILFIRLNRIGDALVSTPLLHAIKQKIGCRIFVLADSKNKAAFSNNPDIDQLLIFNKSLKGYLDIRKFIKTNNIETIVDLHDDTSTTVSFILAFCNAKNKFGLEKENKKIYTRTVPRIDAAKYHIIERLLEITKLFGFEADKTRAKIIYKPNEESQEKTESYLLKNFPEKKFLIGINISSGSSARFWGIEKFKHLVSFLKKYPVSIVIITSPVDFSLAKEISDDGTLIHSTGFDELAALISKLNLLISPDTAPVHLASAFGVPVFGIYVKFNTPEIIWYPYGSEFEYVVTEEPTLQNISFEKVEQKLKPFLEKLLNE